MLLFSIPVGQTLRTRSAVAKCGQIVTIGDTRVQYVILVADLKEYLHIVSLLGTLNRV